MGLFFAIGMRKKIWPMAWRAGAGMAVGGIVGPVIGNLIGPLWFSYFVTFTIIAACMGAAIALRGYRHENSHATTQ